MANENWFFRCITNKSAPLLELSPHEGYEMRTHPDYERVNPITDEVIPWPEAIDAQGRIQFTAARGR